MGKTAMKILSMKDEEFYEGMGRYFVTLAKDAGYERTILQLGRGLRDFFLNLDNLHDYLKYTPARKNLKIKGFMACKKGSKLYNE